MSNEFESAIGQVEMLDEMELTLSQLCRACRLPTERIVALVAEGIVEPSGVETNGDEPDQWRFHSIAILRVNRAHRLERDLGINLAGIALALDLLEEIEQLKRRLQRVQQWE